LKIAIFGSTGFIGSAISQLCLDSNIEVYSFNKCHDERFRGKSFEVDFLNVNSYFGILRDIAPELVVSTVWYTAKNDYRSNAISKYYSEATVRLAESSYATGSNRFIALGSSAEYGDSNFNCNAMTSGLNPLDCYSEAKVECFQKIAQIAENEGKIFNWLRIFQPFGYKQDPLRLMPYLITTLLAGDKPRLTDPSYTCDWISVSDIALATQFCFSYNYSGALDVGTSIGHTNTQILTIIQNLLNQSNHTLEEVILTSEQAKGLVVDRRSPLLMAGWRPSTSLIVGISSLIENANNRSV
jgi:nucleoside-diphosphate-sugar epimerase